MGAPAPQPTDSAASPPPVPGRPTAVLSGYRGARALATAPPTSDVPATGGPAEGMRHALKAAMVTTTVAVLAIVAVTLVLTWGAQLAGYRTHVIVGDSMEPTIPRHSVTIGKLTSQENLDKGDIITFLPPGGDERVTHRIESVELDPDAGIYFRTRGDGNDDVDPWRISYSDGTGWIVVDHVPHIGRILMWMQTPAGRIVFVVLPVLLLAATLLAKLRGSRS